MLDGPPGEFIFIGSDAVQPAVYGVYFGGSISITYPFVLQEEMLLHLRGMTPLNSNDNPWFMENWKNEFNCTFDDENTDRVQCESFESQPLPSVRPSYYLSNTFDGLNALGNGLHTLISDKCPEAFQEKSLLVDCLSGKDLLATIKNITFDGISWTMRFDAAGDIMSPYKYQQYYPNRTEQTQGFASWDKLIGGISLNASLVDWADFGAGADVTRDAHGVPDSVCSYPCGPRQYQQQRELVCCWDCMSCRNNEIINADRDGCEKCPELMWPDDETATYCVEIEAKLVYCKDNSSNINVNTKRLVLLGIEMFVIT